MSEFTEHEVTVLRQFADAVRTAGDGDLDKGGKIVREMLIARRNAGAFYRFAVVVGGALLSFIVFGRQLIENLAWFFGWKFGGK